MKLIIEQIVTEPVMTYEYIIRDREAGNVIDTFKCVHDAEQALKEYYNEDKLSGIFVEDFYEIIKKEKK